MYSLESSGNRLSPLNITDPLLRAELLRDIRLAQLDPKYRNEEWKSYTIQPGDYLSPELIAWKMYSIDTLKWLVMVAAGLDDSRDVLESGRTVYLPSPVWLMERVQYYEQLENT